VSKIFIARSIKWARSDLNEDMIPLFGVLAAGIVAFAGLAIAAPQKIFSTDELIK
jgi:hypothetical protein